MSINHCHEPLHFRRLLPHDDSLFLIIGCGWRRPTRCSRRSRHKRRLLTCVRVISHINFAPAKHTKNDRRTRFLRYIRFLWNVKNLPITMPSSGSKKRCTVNPIDRTCSSHLLVHKELILNFGYTRYEGLQCIQRFHSCTEAVADWRVSPAKILKSQPSKQRSGAYCDRRHPPEVLTRHLEGSGDGPSLIITRLVILLF